MNAIKSVCFSIALIFCSFNHLQAGIEQYFKKATGKTPDHKFDNIDYIYMINLDKRPEKFARSLAQLQPYGINPYRFSAFNGWEELTLEIINEIGVKFEPWMDSGFDASYYPIDGDGNVVHEKIHQPGRTYFCHCLSRGAIGCLMSHLSVLQDAYDSGYQIIWVMEDDVEVVRDPTILPDLIRKLESIVGKGNWDVLFTDRDSRKRDGSYNPCDNGARRPNYPLDKKEKYRLRAAISEDFRVIGARFGAHSMIVSRSGMKRILDFFKTYKVYLPYDIDYFMPRKIRLFTTTYDVVTNQCDALSDNGGAFYKNKGKEGD